MLGVDRKHVLYASTSQVGGATDSAQTRRNGTTRSFQHFDGVCRYRSAEQTIHRSTDCYEKKIAEIIADKTISKRDKTELLNEFEKRLNAAQPIQYPSNIELVRKYYDQIHPIQRDKQG